MQALFLLKAAVSVILPTKLVDAAPNNFPKLTLRHCIRMIDLILYS